MANKFLTAIGSVVAMVTPTIATGYVVTDGKITYSNNKFYVDDSATRMEFPKTDGDSLTILAEYLGKSEKTEALASGVIQEQFGIKLRSANTCNLVYVMRRFSPNSRITIMYKQNPGMTTHEECRDSGYTIIKDISVPVVPIGTVVKLSARFDANILSVLLDDKAIWTGVVDFKQVGIAGFRSDNVKVNFSVLK